MNTMYWSDKISEGKPWYPGSTRFWVKFSSDVNREFVRYKHYKKYVIFLFCRRYRFEDKEFTEYQFQYHLETEDKTFDISRDDIKKTLEYRKDFTALIGD